MKFKVLHFNEDTLFKNYILLYLPLYLIFILFASIESTTIFLLGLIILSVYMFKKAPVFFWLIARKLAPHNFFTCIPKKTGVPLFFHPSHSIKSFINNHQHDFPEKSCWFGIFTVTYDDVKDVHKFFLSVKNLVTIIELSRKPTFFVLFFFYYVVTMALFVISLLLVLIEPAKIFLSQPSILAISFIMLIIIYLLTIHSFTNNYFTEQINENIKHFDRIETFTQDSIPVDSNKMALIAKVNISNTYEIERYTLNELIQSSIKIEKEFSKTKETIIQMSAPLVFVALTAIIIAITGYNPK